MKRMRLSLKNVLIKNSQVACSLHGQSISAKLGSLARLEGHTRNNVGLRIRSTKVVIQYLLYSETVRHDVLFPRQHLVEYIGAGIYQVKTHPAMNQNDFFLVIVWNLHILARICTFWQDKTGPGKEKFKVTPRWGLAPPQTSPPTDPQLTRITLNMNVQEKQLAQPLLFNTEPIMSFVLTSFSN